MDPRHPAESDWARFDRPISPDPQIVHVQQCPTPQTAHIHTENVRTGTVKPTGGILPSISNPRGLRISFGERNSPSSTSSSTLAILNFPRPLDSAMTFDEARYLREQRRLEDIRRNLPDFDTRFPPPERLSHIPPAQSSEFLLSRNPFNPFTSSNSAPAFTDMSRVHPSNNPFYNLRSSDTQRRQSTVSPVNPFRTPASSASSLSSMSPVTLVHTNASPARPMGVQPVVHSPRSTRHFGIPSLFQDQMAPTPAPPAAPTPVPPAPPTPVAMKLQLPAKATPILKGPPPIPPWHSRPKYVQRHQAARMPLDPVKEEVRSVTDYETVVSSNETDFGSEVSSDMEDEVLVHERVYLLPRALPADIAVAQAVVKKIDPLTRMNILEWDSQVLIPITQLQLNGHICKDPSPGAMRTVYNTPVMQPRIPGTDASPEAMEEYDTWRRNDHTVFSLLISRISSACRSSLPGPITDGRITTARELYDTIHRNWGMSSDLGAMAVEDKLLLTKAVKLADVEKYVDNYRRTIETLEKVTRIDWPRYLRHFANGLPNSHTFQDNFSTIMRTARLQGCSKASFEVLAAEVMTTVTNDAHRNGRSTSSVTVTGERPKCEGCGGIGRTKEDCRNCKRKASTTTTTTTTTNTQNTSKARPTVAAVATQQIKEIDAYPVCAIQTEVAALVDSGDVHPLQRLKEESPTEYESLRQSFSTVLDSACTKHIITDLSFFKSYDEFSETRVTTAAGESVVIKGSGMCVFEIQLLESEEVVHLCLHDCLFVPTAPFNLLSGGALIESGFSVSLDMAEGSRLLLPRSVMSAGQRSSWPVDFRHRLFFLHGSFLSSLEVDGSSDHSSRCLSPTDVACFTFERVDDSGDVVHRRLGHIGDDRLRRVLGGSYVTGLKWNGIQMKGICAPCIEGKGVRTPYVNKGNRATHPLALLHMDTCGEFPVQSPSGARYFHIILDDSTNWASLLPMNRKNKASKHVKDTIARLENLNPAREHNWKVLSIRHDNAKEFLVEDLTDWLHDRGITHQVTVPYAHSQNGKAERYIRTVEEGIQVLLADSGLPLQMWEDAALTIVWLLNRLPSKTLPENMTPHEAMTGQKPDLSCVRAWGCQCWFYIPEEVRTKLGPRYKEGIFVGYREGSIGWRVRDKNGRYHFCRDVKFNEGKFGKLGTARNQVQDLSSTTLDIDGDVVPLDDPVHTTVSHGDDLVPADNVPTATLVEIAGPEGPIVIETDFVSASPLIEGEGGGVRRSTRDRKLTPVGKEWEEGRRLADDRRKELLQRRMDRKGVSGGVVGDVVAISVADSILHDFGLLTLEGCGERIEFPQEPFVAPRKGRQKQHDLSKPPRSVLEAKEREDWPLWLRAMRKELESLNEQRVFRAVERVPEGRKALKMLWVLSFMS